MPETSARELIHEIGTAARRASRITACASTEKKNAALERIAQALMTRRDVIQAANAVDLANARSEGLSAAFVDRLAVTDRVLDQMVTGVRQIAELADPVGGIENLRPMPSGIRVGRMRVPLGVIAMSYESRPNVTSDAAALAIKSGNAVILRGGHEAIETNRALAAVVSEALADAALPADAVQLIPTTDRAAVGELIRARDYVDVLIPRGGKGLISRLMAEATVPMIKHLNGICHTYVDAGADLEMALSVVDNAKTQRPSPCNATETLLVHRDEAESFLPMIGKLWTEKNVEMRCDPQALAILLRAGVPAVPATEEDWDTEYNALIISIAVVESLDAAIDFIDLHSSRHTDAIITRSLDSADRFLREVDSSSVMVNASTRFADGFEYGLGAEIGISTDRLHARGPVGLEGLTSLKYIVLGHGEGRS